MANLRRDNIMSTPVLNNEFMQLAHDGRLLPYHKDTIMVNYKNSMATFFEHYMSTEDVTKMEVNHVEQNPACYKVKTGAAASGNDGEEVWVPLNTNSMFMGGTTSMPQVGFMAQLPPMAKNTVIVDIDRTANAHRMKLRPADPSYAIDLSAGAEVVIVPINLAASGDCTVFDSVARQPGKVFRNTLQTVRRSLKVLGEELVTFKEDCTLYPVLDDKGQSHDYLWHHSLSQTVDEFEMGKHQMLFTGEELTNTGFTGKKGTTGFMWALRAAGGYHGYAGDFDKVEWQAVTRKMIAERVFCKQYAFWQGFALNQDTENILSTESAGKLSWGAFGGDSDKWINYGWTGFKMDNVEFYLNTDRHFSDPCYLGADGFGYNQLGVMVPLEEITDTKGNTHKHVVVNYLASQGMSRRFMQWDTGILKPETNSTNCDYHVWNFLSTLGMEAWAMNAFYLVEKLS
jgi:hypothetical protein